MKKTVLLGVMALSLFNCDGKKEDKKLKDSNTIETKTNVPGAKTTDIVQKTYGTYGENEIDNAIVNFQACKESAIEREDCRNALSAFISEKYTIEDFKGPNGNYLIYDSIQPIVKRSSAWRNIGSITDQVVIDEAVSYAGKGGLALVIDTSKHYGHVVIVQSGKTISSGSWGLKVPQVISLSNHKPAKSFHDKAISYAFKKDYALQVYVRE